MIEMYEENQRKLVRSVQSLSIKRNTVARLQRKVQCTVIALLRKKIYVDGGFSISEGSREEMTGIENRFLEGTYTPFLADVVTAMSTQATRAPSNDVAASSRKRKGSGDGRQGKAKISRVISSVVHPLTAY